MYALSVVQYWPRNILVCVKFAVSMSIPTTMKIPQRSQTHTVGVIKVKR